MPTGFVAASAAEAGSIITASPQAIFHGKSASGALRVTRTRSGATASTASMSANSAFCALTESGARARSSENTTSEASKSAPS